MAQKRQRAKGRQTSASFVRMRHDFMCTDNFASLTPIATKLLLEIARHYNGYNNGDFSIPWSRMKNRGFNSRDTLYRARKELLEKGWIIQTRQGGKNKASLYGVTWEAIDECNGKLDVGPTRKPPDDWKSADWQAHHRKQVR